MSNPWESLCQELSQGPDCSFPEQTCFNSVKLNGLHSVKSDFIPDERLLACKSCGVIFIHDRLLSHYDYSHSCDSTNSQISDILPYHAINLCQTLLEKAQNQEKEEIKRLKAGSLRKSKSFRTLPQVELISCNSNHKGSSEHKRKRDTVKSSVERGKLSSSSSCDRFSSTELNSPASPSTESSWSVASKITENPVDLLQKYPRKGLMEMLFEETASLSSKSRRMCANSTKPAILNKIIRSPVETLLNAHSQSYPSSPVSPKQNNPQKGTFFDLKQTYNATASPNEVNTESHTLLSRAQKRSSAALQYKHRYSPQFFSEQSKVCKSARLSMLSPQTMGVETIDLISDDSFDTDNDSATNNSVNDEIAEAVYHLEQDAFASFSKQNQLQNRPRNGLKSDFLQASHPSKQWGTSDFLPNNKSWSLATHSSASNSNYVCNSIKREQTDPLPTRRQDNHAYNSAFGIINSASKSISDRSLSNLYDFDRSSEMNQFRLQRHPYQHSERNPVQHTYNFDNKETVVNSLTQCGCVEMGDIQCKNSILCTVHTVEEKRCVPRQRDLKFLMREARNQQQLLKQCKASAANFRRVAGVPKTVQLNSGTSNLVSTTWTCSTTNSAARVPPIINSNVLPMRQLPPTSSSTTSVQLNRRLPAFEPVSSYPASVYASNFTQDNYNDNPIRSMPIGRYPPSIIRNSADNSSSSSGPEKRSGGGNYVFASRNQEQGGATGSPAILHRKVHPSSLLRRSHMWLGQNNSAGGDQQHPVSVASNLQQFASIKSSLSYYQQQTGIDTSAGDPNEFQSRVVVNDVREKSITGRSRKSSRSSFRQTTAPIHEHGLKLRIVNGVVSKPPNPTFTSGAFLPGQMQSFAQPSSSSVTTNQNRPTVLLRTANPNQVNLRDNRLVGSGKSDGKNYLKQQLPSSSSASLLHPDMLAAARAVVQQSSPACTTTSSAQNKFVSATGFIQQHQKLSGLQSSSASSFSSVSDPIGISPAGLHSSSLPGNRYILIGAQSLKKRQSTTNPTLICPPTMINRMNIPPNTVDLMPGSGDPPFEHLSWAGNTNGGGQLVDNPQRGICNNNAVITGEVDESMMAAAVLTDSSSSSVNPSVVCGLSVDSVDELEQLSRQPVPHLRHSVQPGQMFLLRTRRM